MYLVLQCPSCGGNTTNHIEYNNGFARNIYNCANCNWTNRYTQTIFTSTTPINTYINGTYLTTSTTISKGGYKNARG